MYVACQVLFGCFRKNLSEESKVVQIAGYIAEQTAYHHGEASLHATIVHMAQVRAGYLRTICIYSISMGISMGDEVIGCHN